MPDLAHYMSQYDHEHSSGWNKLLHEVGIPMIFLGILLLLFMKWIWGGSFFVGGWILLLLDTRSKEIIRLFFKGQFICW
ncbi:MAG: Mpo1-like protein [Candidatus Acidiferrum sp.]